ncbi:MAG TPA: LiaF domain-containing protein [Chloroflexia bacterium]|nr:LiaF domain-containing protein [Chloroflexia bacterium]
MKVETPGNGTGPGTPTKPVSESLPEWSTNWPPPGEQPTSTPEQARAALQDYEVNPAPETAARYAPPETPAPVPAFTPTSGPATTPVAPYTPAPAPTPTYVAPVRERPNESSGLIWPILLIVAGGILLLNTLGVLSWTVWNGIWRLWPLALIFIGLELLFGRRSRLFSYVLAGLLIVTVAGLAMAWSVMPWTGGTINTQSISQPISGATSADVEISLGVGNLTVNPLANAGGDIMQGTIAVGSNERLERNYTVNGGVGKLTLINRGLEGAWFGNASAGPRDHVININPAVPLTLRIDGGVGDSKLNLADFNLTRLQVSSGVGNVEIALPGNVSGTSNVSVSGGVGDVTVNVPEGTALRVQASQGVGSRNFPSSYTNDGEVWTSPNYDTAANRMNMQVSGGVGSLHVREVGR